MRQKTVERHYTRHPRAPNGTEEGTWCPPVIEAESGGAMTAAGAILLDAGSAYMPSAVAEAKAAAMDNAVDVWRLETASRLHCAYGS